MKTKIVCFGEILFDVFPTQRKIGGAPLNVALRMNSLGIDAHIISRIGNDEVGKELLHFLEKNDISTNNIQIDNKYSTGEVFVKLDDKGSASYTINYPVAWDKIEATSEATNVVKDADALVFGSLACRDITSYLSLLTLLNSAKHKIFDVNLRPPFYNKELLLDLMEKADFIKFNDDELYETMDLEKFEYKNMIFDSLTIDNFWLDGKSKFSQMQQIDFLERLYFSKLPISKKTENIMKDIMQIEKTENFICFE